MVISRKIFLNRFNFITNSDCKVQGTKVVACPTLNKCSNRTQIFSRVGSNKNWIWWEQVKNLRASVEKENNIIPIFSFKKEW